MDVSVEANPGQMPRLKIAHRSSYMKSETKKHDDDATKYMSYALFPMIICYFIYSLVYDKHKSWCVPGTEMQGHNFVMLLGELAAPRV